MSFPVPPTFPPLLLGAAGNPLEHIMPHELGRIGGYTFTNHVVMLVASAVLLAILMPIAARAEGIVPRGFRNLVEAVLQYVREDMARPVLGHATDGYIAYIWTVFLLILTANLLGMIPIGAAAQGIDAHLAHLGGTATGNFSITGGLAACSFVLIHLSGMREQGVGRYWHNFFFGHAPFLLSIFLIPIEILGSFIKAFALAIRLFANMIAGHVVITVLLGFAAVGLTAGGAHLGITAASILGAVFIDLLEVLVAFLQAYIFTFLTIVFVGLAIHVDH